ncbi:hypothetical protein FJ364_05860, partial [Candidatus Dependentiae bacterium]|nr:hypothetical protein [Candidatus Dependentiae bacterium]
MQKYNFYLKFCCFHVGMWETRFGLQGVGGESSNDGGYEGGMGKEIEESSNDGGYETFTITEETMQVAKEDFPSTM